MFVDCGNFTEVWSSSWEKQNDEGTVVEAAVKRLKKNSMVPQEVSGLLPRAFSLLFVYYKYVNSILSSKNGSTIVVSKFVCLNV